MIFLGDTHGNDAFIQWTIKQKKITNEHIIHVGDYGVGFTRTSNEIKKLEFFNEFLKERDITLHVIRGNHDDPKFFKGDYLLSNLKLHPDYTVLEIENKKILGIGGAISIDRVPRRLETNSHWEDELFVLNEDFLKEVRGIDILVTHTTPSFIPPINVPGKTPEIINRFATYDDKLMDDLILERELLSTAFNIINENNNITHHFYGHFHQNIRTLRFNCQHICLNIGEFFPLINYTDYEKELNKKYGK